MHSSQGLLQDNVYSCVAFCGCVGQVQGEYPSLIRGLGCGCDCMPLVFVIYTLYVGCMVICIIIYQFDSTEQYSECHS